MTGRWTPLLSVALLWWPVVFIALNDPVVPAWMRIAEAVAVRLHASLEGRRDGRALAGARMAA